MNIVNPPGITTFNPIHLHVVHHTTTGADEFTLTVYPFETVHGLKQRISHQFAGDRTMLPDLLFVAKEGSNGYVPLDYEWIHANQPLQELEDPLENACEIDKRFYDQGALVSSTVEHMFTGITVEHALGEETTIHVWNSESILTRCGAARNVSSLPAETYAGFVRKYYPQFDLMDMFVSANRRDDATVRKEYDIINAYVESYTNRVAGIERALSQPRNTTVQLYELRSVTYTLPILVSYQNAVLELKFHDMKPNASVPFIRYFSSNSREAPLAKLATSSSGMPVISDTELLRTMMADEPDTSDGAIILLKAPLTGMNMPVGTCWTLRIHQDGSAAVYLNAPRVDKPLNTANVIRALQVLERDFLPHTPWENAADLTLSNIEATYKLVVPEQYSVSLERLERKLKAFTPLFVHDKEMQLKQPCAQQVASSLTLSYIAVNHYMPDSNPIYTYIAGLYTVYSAAAGAKSAVEAAIATTNRVIADVSSTYGMTEREATRYVSKFNDDEVSRRESGMLYNRGVVVNVCTTQLGQYLRLSGVDNAEDLQRILSSLRVLFTHTLGELGEAGETVAEPVIERPVERPVEPIVEPAGEPADEIDDNTIMTEFENEMGRTGEQEPPYIQTYASYTDTPEEVVQTVLDSDEYKAAVEGLDDEVLIIVTTVRYLLSLKRKAPTEAPEPEVPERQVIDTTLKGILDPSQVVVYMDLLAMLKEADPMFSVTPKYATKCQLTQRRQPNVLSPEMYGKVREIYKEHVKWVEAPLHADDRMAINVVSSSVKERANKFSILVKSVLKKEEEAPELPDSQKLSQWLRNAADKKPSIELLARLEKRALEMGFPLKGDKSVIDDVKPTDENRQLKEDIQRLKEEQATSVKPVWIVYRLGSDINKPNYYICAEYWCMYDGVPLISDWVTKKGQMPDGTIKPADACPFCKGTLITGDNIPGQSVWVRNVKDKKLHPYIGLMEYDDYKPDHPLPCCYTTPTSMDPQVYTYKFPEPTYIQEIEERPEAVAPVEELPRQETFVESVEDIKRPFSPKSSSGTAQNPYYILNANVLHREKKEWDKISKRGAVAIPPPAVNQFLGQTVDSLLAAKGGFVQQTKFAIPGRGFVRYCISPDSSRPGENFLTFLAYVDYAVSHLRQPDKDHIMSTSDEMLTELFNSPKTKFYIHAFEQANYGTLLHEFTLPGERVTDQADFDAWRRLAGYMKDEVHTRIKEDITQRAYNETVYLAWRNFERYMRDLREPKQWKYWDAMIATRWLLSTGAVIVRIVIPKNNPTEPYIVCPSFGVSQFAQSVSKKPSCIFVLEDEKHGMYDPLVFCESIDAKNRHVFGALNPESQTINLFSDPVRTALVAFMNRYYSTDGCGRESVPLHPLNPLAKLPQLSHLYSVVDAKEDMTPYALLRDRSNRLAGLVVTWKSSESRRVNIYLPCVDDGYIVNMPSIRGDGIEAMPKPHVVDLLSMLRGKQNITKEKHLITQFPGYMPTALWVDEEDKIYAVKMACGAVVPVAPISIPAPNETLHRTLSELVTNQKFIMVHSADAPWMQDIAVGTSSSDMQTTEDEFEEAYQYVRLSFSNWLFADTADSMRVRERIEELRKARKRLPLWELQKRLELLLIPVILPWIKQNDEVRVKYGILRRDCLELPQSECKDGCAWVGNEGDGTCRIHARSTSRYVNPARTFIARIVDELLRTFGQAMELLQHKVSQLRSMEGDVTHEDGMVVFSVDGRGDSELYKRLGYTGIRASQYTMGYVYPEEVSIDDIAKPPSVKEVPVGILTADWAPVYERTVLGAELHEPVDILRGVIHVLLRRRIDDFSGTDAQWKMIADDIRVDIIKTRLDAGRKLVPIDAIEYSRGAGGHDPESVNYIVLDERGIPLRVKQTKKYTLVYTSLPASLQTWLRNPHISPPAPVPVQVPQPAEEARVEPVPAPPAPLQEPVKCRRRDEVLISDPKTGEVKCKRPKTKTRKNKLPPQVPQKALPAAEVQMVIEELPEAPPAPQEAPPAPREAPPAPVRQKVINPLTGRSVYVNRPLGRNLTRKQAKE